MTICSVYCLDQIVLLQAYHTQFACSERPISGGGYQYQLMLFRQTSTLLVDEYMGIKWQPGSMLVGTHRVFQHFGLHTHPQTSATEANTVMDGVHMSVVRTCLSRSRRMSNTCEARRVQMAARKLTPCKAFLPC